MSGHSHAANIAAKKATEIDEVLKICYNEKNNMKESSYEQS